MRMLFDLRSDLNNAADTVNQIELVRSQIEGLARLVDDRGDQEGRRRPEPEAESIWR